jgi:hypothetical protein
MLLSFIDKAETLGLDDVLARKEASIQKLGQMCLRYGVNVARGGYFHSARNYLNLSLVFDRSLSYNPLYLLLKRCLAPGAEDIASLDRELSAGNYLVKRTISYNPPDGHIEIKGA